MSVASDGDKTDQQWWFCLKHRSVEFGRGCAATDRMGPYADEAAAARALDSAAQRTQDWDERDED